MYSDFADPFVIARKFLERLNPANRLKPAVWAEHKDTSSYGVSVGVDCFVRPLYLYKKLCTLRDVEDSKNLQDVQAFGIKYTEAENNKNARKSPCLTCQCFFGFTSQPMIGNCAEYDVIGNVNPHLLETQQWQEFKSACQQHLDAFNAMKTKISEENMEHENIIKTYFENTHHPKKPKVLDYKWNSKTNGFKLIVAAWPSRKEHTIYARHLLSLPCLILLALAFAVLLISYCWFVH